MIQIQLQMFIRILVRIQIQNNFLFFNSLKNYLSTSKIQIILGKPQKKSFLSGPATIRGGVKAGPLRKYYIGPSFNIPTKKL